MAAKAHAAVRSAVAAKICCRATAISRSRAPASRNALARSIGSTTLPGISAVSTGRRGGGAGVALESRGVFSDREASAAPCNGAIAGTGSDVGLLLNVGRLLKLRLDPLAPLDP